MSSEPINKPAEPEISLAERVFWLFVRVVICVVLIALFIWFVRPKPGVVDFDISGDTMGTLYHVILAGVPEYEDKTAVETEIQRELDKIDSLMSTFKDDSEVSRFNVSESTDWFTVSAETAEVVALAIDVSRLTDGAFDVTVAPLAALWGFDSKASHAQEPPTQDVIDNTLKSVGWQHLEVRREPPAIKKSLPQLQIDLSGIAKGYAVDAVAALLERKKITNYLVEIGGEVRTSGTKQAGVAWVAGIENPVLDDQKDATVFTKVEMKNNALATSGDYRSYRSFDTLRVSHIIDPRTGSPLERMTTEVAGHSTSVSIIDPDEHLASVSILAPKCAKADALATAMFVLGETKATELAEKEKIPMLMLYRNKNVNTRIRTVESKTFPKTR
ncbi:MAG: FAD:protein FMN transferase [Planctomycetaceae bacterium]|jgi:thiamine biosynthesis lipoprotein|nr:FAD:protein FMN transferase [Planctomycetaceae bacterium]